MELAYWKKQGTKPLFQDLEWNLPEQKTGTISVFGGNAQNFSSVVRSAEYLSSHFPIQETCLVLPDALHGKLPPLPNIIFTPSTESGSFGKSSILADTFTKSNYNLLVGDVSKNSATAIAIMEAIKTSDRITNSEKPLLITRDTIDLLTPTFSELIERQNVTIIASMAQVQKIFRAVYYPKVLLLSMPLIPVLETLHKFTLSYPGLTILTFHQDHIIVANGGKIITVEINTTNFTPLSLWGGTLACKVAAMQLYNPSKPLEAAVDAITFE